MASLRDNLGDVVEGAELEDEVAPVVGRQVDLHLDVLSHDVSPPDDAVPKVSPGLVFPWLFRRDILSSANVSVRGCVSLAFPLSARVSVMKTLR